MSEHADDGSLPKCQCAEFWDSHHPDCPVLGHIRALEAKLAASRENEARYLAVKAFCEANAHVSAHSKRHRWSMEVNALDTNPSFDAAIDAARRAGEGEGP